MRARTRAAVLGRLWLLEDPLGLNKARSGGDLVGAKTGGSATHPPRRLGPRRFAGRVARVRLPCCRVFYVGGFSDAKLTGCKDSRLRRARWSPKPIERLNLGLVYGRILSLTTCRALRKAPLRQRKVAAARSAVAAPPSARLRKIAGCRGTNAPRRHQRSAPHRSGTLCSAGSEAVSSGSPQGVAQSALLCNTTWSPPPKHHRKKKQRHRLC